MKAPKDDNKEPESFSDAQLPVEVVPPVATIDAAAPNPTSVDLSKKENRVYITYGGPGNEVRDETGPFLPGVERLVTEDQAERLQSLPDERWTVRREE